LKIVTGLTNSHSSKNYFINICFTVLPFTSWQFIDIFPFNQLAIYVFLVLLLWCWFITNMAAKGLVEHLYRCLLLAKSKSYFQHPFCFYFKAFTLSLKGYQCFQCFDYLCFGFNYFGILGKARGNLLNQAIRSLYKRILVYVICSIYVLMLHWGPSWLYDSWVYNYLYNQCQSN